jgi:hypothetical protein
MIAKLVARGGLEHAGAVDVFWESMVRGGEL